MTQAFFDFLTAVHKNKPRPQGLFKGRLLGLDPGETLGHCIWVSVQDALGNVIGYNMESCGQLACWDKEAHKINPCVLGFPALLTQLLPLLDSPGKARLETDILVSAEVVMESYRVYEWKTDSHAWSDVPTLRIIGSIETRLIDANIPFTMQTAQQAKNFIKDELLKAWGFYERGQRHSRDAMRHSLFYLLFGK